MGVEDVATLAGALGIGTILPDSVRWVGRLLSRSTAHEISREEHISILRKALDKAGIRFNGAVSVCDLLLIALEMVEDLPPAARHAKQEARAKLAAVVRTLEAISGVVE